MRLGMFPVCIIKCRAKIQYAISIYFKRTTTAKHHTHTHTITGTKEQVNCGRIGKNCRGVHKCTCVSLFVIMCENQIRNIRKTTFTLRNVFQFVNGLVLNTFLLWALKALFTTSNLDQFTNTHSHSTLVYAFEHSQRHRDRSANLWQPLISSENCVSPDLLLSWWKLLVVARWKVYGAALVTSVSHGHPWFKWKNPDTIHSVVMSGFGSFFFKSFSFSCFTFSLVFLCLWPPLFCLCVSQRN